VRGRTCHTASRAALFVANSLLELSPEITPTDSDARSNTRRVRHAVCRLQEMRSKSRSKFASSKAKKKANLAKSEMAKFYENINVFGILI
tara:strand:+ start:174 stop:443 length:270 start_codon:yes stop_codon:yes gene_type:complete